MKLYGLHITNVLKSDLFFYGKSKYFYCFFNFIVYSYEDVGLILLFYLRVYTEMTGKKHNQAIKKTKSLGFTKIPPPFFKQPRRTMTKAAEGYTNFNTAGAVSLCFDFFKFFATLSKPLFTKE